LLIHHFYVCGNLICCFLDCLVTNAPCNVTLFVHFRVNNIFRRKLMSLECENVHLLCYSRFSPISFYHFNCVIPATICYSRAGRNPSFLLLQQVKHVFCMTNKIILSLCFRIILWTPVCMEMTYWENRFLLLKFVACGVVIHRTFLLYVILTHYLVPYQRKLVSPPAAFIILAFSFCHSRVGGN
jgi:hypothetical protein